MKTIAFFNNKGGVGKTSLVFHLAWMLADKGCRVAVADLDPQANLTSMFLGDDRTEAIWSQDVNRNRQTIYGALWPILEGTGDVAHPHVERIGDRIGLIPGDLALSLSEDELNSQWPQCLNRSPRAYRVMTAFHRAISSAAAEIGAQIALIDVGPNLGALNRSALIAADFVLFPLAPDLFSLQGLTNLGQRLGEWRSDWSDRYRKNTVHTLPLPTGKMSPLGYVLMKHSVRLERPVKAYDYWMKQIPPIYSKSMLPEEKLCATSVELDPNCLAMLKDYRSMMPIAQRSHKPIFYLTGREGVFGSNTSGVQEARRDFEQLADRILLALDSHKHNRKFA